VNESVRDVVEVTLCIELLREREELVIEAELEGGVVGVGVRGCLAVGEHRGDEV